MKKQEEIIKMFDDIAKTYDLANRILSFGIDKIWRKKACNFAYLFYNHSNLKICDVACGTADLMIDWIDVAKTNGVVVEEIIGIDPSKEMLEIAKKKLDATYINKVAEDTSLDNSSVDIVSISYGIRNVVKRKEAFNEFYRILKKDGLLVILEFTKNKNKLANFYLRNIMPTIGGIISKNKDAYNYLANSIDNFVTTEQLKKELEEAGFEVIFIKPYSLGISTTFIARKK